jgi:pSer/pThr/pTyr-binding forkhead associated (FHA) protein
MPSLGDSLPPQAAWIELPDRRTHVLAGDCSIGRTDENAIVNPDIRISRKHSVVQRRGNHYVLVDLGSTNGTFLNGNRIFKPTRLKDGDIILIGSLEYTFCQPADAGGADASHDDSSVQRTAIVVGKISCWMLLVVPRRPVDADATDWLKAMRATLELGGAGAKVLADDALLAHWREHRATPERVRDSVLAISRRPVPAGAHLVLHFGAVRVGQGAAGGENLLGAEVTFTHSLAAVAAKLKVGFLVSEPAVGSLGLGAQAKPLGSHAVGDIPGRHSLFAL